MDILFIIDRIELKYFEFNNLVTNFWIIREFLTRNNNVSITTIDKLSCVEIRHTHTVTKLTNATVTYSTINKIL